MPGQLYAFERPDRFVAGTVGEPGQRTFYLQATGSGRTVSVALEKIQVAALAERLVELLEEARRRLGADVGPDEVGEVDAAPLETPIEQEFRVGTLALAWDAQNSIVIVEATAAPPEDDAEVSADELSTLRVQLTPAETRAFVARAVRVVAAGRPACPLCSLPLEPAGHVCPRHNGYRR